MRLGHHAITFLLVAGGILLYDAARDEAGEQGARGPMAPRPRAQPVHEDAFDREPPGLELPTPGLHDLRRRLDGLEQRLDRVVTRISDLAAACAAADASPRRPARPVLEPGDAASMDVQRFQALWRQADRARRQRQLERELHRRLGGLQPSLDRGMRDRLIEVALAIRSRAVEVRRQAGDRSPTFALQSLADELSDRVDMATQGDRTALVLEAIRAVALPGLVDDGSGG